MATARLRLAVAGDTMFPSRTPYFLRAWGTPRFPRRRSPLSRGPQMSLIARIEEDLKAARLARDEDRRDALSLVLNALQNAQKELQRPLSDDEELQVLQRERKRRVEAADAFRGAGREEQAEDEEYELEILEEFMPEPMSEDELEEIIDDVISEVGATSIRTWAG